MGYYDKFLMHEDKRDKGMNSTSNEKGTDGKKNNTSEYNHQYYMKNKDKWGVKSSYSEYTDDDHDFDEKNYSEENRLGDTDFYGFQKPDGSWVILEEDMKWTIPAGTSKEDLIKALEAFDKSTEAKRDAGEKYTADDWQKAASDAINGAIKGNTKTSEQEFDLDAAAMDVIRGKYKNGAERKEALGEDYEMVQKRVNEIMKGMKSSSSESNKPDTSTSSSSAQNDQSKETSSSSKPEASIRQRNITGSAESVKNDDKPKASIRQRNITGSASSESTVKHSEVYENMNDRREYQDELFHHGIKGQKWGVRRFQNADGTLKTAGKNRRNERYSDEQYGRDKQVYGTLGARRINRNMNKGDMVSTARSKEAARINKTREAAKWAGRGTSTAVAVASLMGAGQKVKDIVNKQTNFKYDQLLGHDSPYAPIIDLGMASIAGSLSYKIGQGGAMAVAGYSPSKFRY